VSKAVKATTGHPTTPKCPNSAVKAEEIQAGDVHFSCCEMQEDAV